MKPSGDNEVSRGPVAMRRAQRIFASLRARSSRWSPSMKERVERVISGVLNDTPPDTEDALMVLLAVLAEDSRTPMRGVFRPRPKPPPSKKTVGRPDVSRSQAQRPAGRSPSRPPPRPPQKSAPRPTQKPPPRPAQKSSVRSVQRPPSPQQAPPTKGKRGGGWQQPSAPPRVDPDRPRGAFRSSRLSVEADAARARQEAPQQEPGVFQRLGSIFGQNKPPRVVSRSSGRRVVTWSSGESDE